MIPLYAHQKKALVKMKNGCILCGDVGSGKSRAALAYYYIRYGGNPSLSNKKGMMKNPPDLYVITTARKRDTKDWEGEFIPFLIGSDLYKNRVVVDSWNNVKKYVDVKNAFFIFDEQRVVGYGTWSKSFIKIARQNEWIMLSATPGDTWMDYIPVFIANGFYKNKTEFIRRHVIYKRFVKFPVVDRYVNEGRLIKHRRDILVDMPFGRATTQHHEDVWCSYDKDTYRRIIRDRWDVFKDEPIENAGGLCYCLRRAVNASESRQIALLELLEDHDKVIIFYNFDYELHILKEVCADGSIVAEWNGHKHERVPTSERWRYLVQYTAGCEGWNCVSTDTIIFFSQNYSYKVMKQAAGRIDRLNTTYTDLWYYHLKSRSGIDLAINRALSRKEKFNETSFVLKQ